MLFLCHPNCTTCKKALLFLESRGISPQIRDIRTENPSADELTRWQQVSSLPMKRFFNTSGPQYRILGLSEKLPGMDDAQQLALLASDGMLVTRPSLVGRDVVLGGFRQKEWEAIL